MCASLGKRQHAGFEEPGRNRVSGRGSNGTPRGGPILAASPHGRTGSVRDGRLANLAICGRDAATLERAAKRLRALGVQVVALTCDVRNRGEVAQAIFAIRDAYGQLDMLVNNAGTFAVGPLESMTREDYEDALNTHFWALYCSTDAALPIFEEQGGGRIVNIAAIGGKVSVPHLLPYCVSKFAAVGYSEGLRPALHPKKIFVTTVVPGPMRTGSPRNAWFKAQHEKEYTWFTLSDTLPGFSIGASSAARAIVDASLRGDAEIVLSLPARIAVLANAIAPGFTARTMQLAARLLPGPGGIDRRKMRGRESTTRITESPLTILGKKAERDYNQIA